MAQRIGLATIRALAFKMCRMISTFGPIIARTYPNNDALMAALAASQAACKVLIMEADAALPVGD